MHRKILIFDANGAPMIDAGPEGAAQEVRRFPTEPWMASRKIRAELQLLTGDLSGKGLSLVTFFGPFKESYPPIGGSCCCCFTCRSMDKQDQQLSAKAEFISFDEPKRNGTKEKGSPRRS